MNLPAKIIPMIQALPLDIRGQIYCALITYMLENRFDINFLSERAIAEIFPIKEALDPILRRRRRAAEYRRRRKEALLAASNQTVAAQPADSSTAQSAPAEISYPQTVGELTAITNAPATEGGLPSLPQPEKHRSAQESAFTPPLNRRQRRLLMKKNKRRMKIIPLSRLQSMNRQDRPPNISHG